MDIKLLRVAFLFYFPFTLGQSKERRSSLHRKDREQSRFHIPIFTPKTNKTKYINKYSEIAPLQRRLNLILRQSCNGRSMNNNQISWIRNERVPSFVKFLSLCTQSWKLSRGYTWLQVSAKRIYRNVLPVCSVSGSECCYRTPLKCNCT